MSRLKSNTATTDKEKPNDTKKESYLVRIFESAYLNNNCFYSSPSNIQKPKLVDEHKNHSATSQMK